MAFSAVSHVVRLLMMMSVTVFVELLCYVLLRLVFEAGLESHGTLLEVEALGFTSLAVSTTDKYENFTFFPWLNFWKMLIVSPK